MWGRDFLTIVSHLKGVESEASLRTGTGRLYYAAFLEARSYCEQRLGYHRSHSSREHAEVPRLLRALDIDLADNLVFLRELRNAADYDLDLSINTVVLQAEQSSRRAKSVIARLDDLPAPGAVS